MNNRYTQATQDINKTLKKWIRLERAELAEFLKPDIKLTKISMLSKRSDCIIRTRRKMRELKEK